MWWLVGGVLWMVLPVVGVACVVLRFVLCAVCAVLLLADEGI